MTKRSQSLLMLYLALIIALAALGATNQDRHPLPLRPSRN